MKTKRQILIRCLAAIVIGGGMLGSGVATAQSTEVSEVSEGMEVLTRGPVHEAFAETVAFDPEPGIIVPQQPPELIEEVMPEQRPEGDNVAWIPGYWAWDEEGSEFLWISGIWRNLPPGREWVPGYWAQVDTGHQWTSGYWQDAEVTEVTYLPEPPKSVEAGPNIEASSDDQTWIPGSWQYEDDRYAWRAGSWVTARANWAWTPSYYRWTHRGYVYVDGYWDYPVVNRGVIFAPVRFHRSYYSRPDYYYRPQTVISLSVFSNHLFLRPSYGHYYFGDYYEPRYRNRYYPSYAYSSRYRGYDPIYSHYRWENRHDRNWDRQRQNYFEHRRDNAGARPPRTWAALNNLSQQDRQRHDFGVADRYDRVVGNRDGGGRRFQAVSANERERFTAQRNGIRNFARERKQREAGVARATADRPGRAQVSRVKVDRSPVASRRAERSEKNGGPPARLQQRASERKATTANQGGNGNARQAGRNTPQTAAKARQTERRGGNAAARTEDRPNRETRTKPGQRRDDALTPNRKAAASNNRPNTQAGGRAETNRKANPSAESRAGQGRQSADKRAATSNAQRKATPQTQRKSERTEAKNPAARKAAPSRNAAATRQQAQKAAPQRAQQQKAKTQRQTANQQPKRQAAPQRQAAKAQPKRQAAPQRQAAKPQPKRQAAPQRQAAKPQAKRQAAPQRQAARPQPKRQAAPQRQAARPQPQRAASRPQAKPAARAEKAAERKAQNRKNRQE